MDNGVSVYALSPYRNYLMSEQVVSAVSIKNDDEIDDNQVVREYMRLVESGFKPQNVVHLGKRGSGHGFLKDEIDGMSNIDWFKQEYSEENWIDLVDNAKRSFREGNGCFCTKIQYTWS